MLLPGKSLVLHGALCAAILLTNSSVTTVYESGSVVRSDRDFTMKPISMKVSRSWAVASSRSTYEPTPMGTGRNDILHLAAAVSHADAPTPETLSGPVPLPADIVINEIQFDPPPRGSEFIELYNRSARQVALHTLTYRDATSSRVPLTETAVFLAPGRYAVLVQDGASFEEQFPGIPFLEPESWRILNNSGDAAIIEAGGTTIDSVAFDAAMDADRSIERIDPNGPSEAFNFAPSSDPSGATPGRQNSRFSPDYVGPTLVFVAESGDAQLDLYFNEPVHIDADVVGGIFAGASQAEEATATRPRVLTVRFAALPYAGSVFVESIEDRSGNRSSGLRAQIAYLPRERDVVITEIHYEPLADDRDGLDDQVEYVEVSNRSSRRVSLEGIYRTRDADETGDADTVRVHALRVDIDAGSLAVFASDSFMTGALPAPGLSLRNEGDAIRLHGPTGEMLDEVRYVPSWHHPDLLTRRGISLERIDVDLDGNAASNWTSSVDPTGGTPGRPNSVAATQPRNGHASALTIAPNPFSPDRDGIDDVTRITFVPRTDASRVRVRIFDASGLQVRELTASQLAAGSASFIWDGRDDSGRRLRTGIYIAHVESVDARNGVRRASRMPLVLAR